MHIFTNTSKMSIKPRWYKCYESSKVYLKMDIMAWALSVLHTFFLLWKHFSHHGSLSRDVDVKKNSCYDCRHENKSKIRQNEKKRKLLTPTTIFHFHLTTQFHHFSFILNAFISGIVAIHVLRLIILLSYKWLQITLKNVWK